MDELNQVNESIRNKLEAASSAYQQVHTFPWTSYLMEVLHLTPGIFDIRKRSAVCFFILWILPYVNQAKVKLEDFSSQRNVLVNYVNELNEWLESKTQSLNDMKRNQKPEHLQKARVSYEAKKKSLLFYWGWMENNKWCYISRTRMQICCLRMITSNPQRSTWTAYVESFKQRSFHRSKRWCRRYQQNTTSHSNWQH